MRKSYFAVLIVSGIDDGERLPAASYALMDIEYGEPEDNLLNVQKLLATLVNNFPLTYTA
jgi:hypothetical protein